jgi:nucleoside-diphosphate-sugar epimerase
MERLVALVKRGLPLPLGAIRNRRSFTFVRNLTDVTEVALAHPSAENAIFLVADGEDLSTPELIRRIARHAGVRTPLISVPSTVMHGIAGGADAWTAATGAALPFGTSVLRRLESSLYVDTGPLRARLDWTPPFSVDEGLRCMLTPP